jgi:hypothetical protein
MPLAVSEWPLLVTVRPRISAKNLKRIGYTAVAILVAPHAMQIGWSVVGRASRPTLLHSIQAPSSLSPISANNVNTANSAGSTMTDDSANYGG